MDDSGSSVDSSSNAGFVTQDTSLWNQAWNELSDEDKALFPGADAIDKDLRCAKLLDIVQGARDICQEGRVICAIGERRIIVRDCKKVGFPLPAFFLISYPPLFRYLLLLSLPHYLLSSVEALLDPC